MMLLTIVDSVIVSQIDQCIDILHPYTLVAFDLSTLVCSNIPFQVLHFTVNIELLI